ncbi:DNA-directed RNA polymerase subunit alpha [Patescibacteria group bacterium]|nr:DNA-directed RNA polymerase subunit alpha [Patescibacteria group bacterium]MBU1703532.1 DNA-directed RNA polymerase subunit alpha [Patescibacteria group bacterium]MBU1953439.1 DNA-directed RNA polymerase subunit alpha [Patescibacteria group bacterium]
MHQIQAEIGIPKIKTERISSSHAVFTVSPLPPGYGTTVGNSFRRILLSSLPGACVTGVKIDGISHEYSSIKGVKDSILDITLNLKLLNLKKPTSEPSFLTLSANKEGEVTAKDIKCPSDVEILNPDLYITTLEKGAKFNMEIRVEKGVGYIPAAQRQKEETDSDMIVLDSIYSPVRRVRYEVESTRVGQMTNLDKLKLEIMTDGSISPEDALKFSSNILQSYFNLFNQENAIVEEDFMSDFKKIQEKEQEDEKNKPAQESYTPIEILGFSPRTLNALINGGIGSVEQLEKCTESKLTNLRGFGKKALTEVGEALETKGKALSKE